jgi:O-antigen/teichoic acid export membrane protein
MGDNKYKYLIKNTGFLAISSFSSRILVFLLVPFYTNILSTSEYGIYDLATTTIQLLMPILTLNVYEGVTRFLMSDKENPNTIVTLGFKYIAVGTAIFALALWANTILYIFPLFSGYELLIFLYFVSNVLYQYAVQCAKGFELVKYMGIAGVISTVVMVFTNVLFLAIWHIGLPGFFLSYILGQSIAAIYLFWKIEIIRYLKNEDDYDLQKRLVYYSVPLILNTIGWWINNASDRYIVTWLCGVSINGIYSVSYKIPSILSTFQSIFTQSWQISAIKEYQKEGYRRFYTRMLETINLIIGIACMALILFTKVIARVLYAKDFYSAWEYVPFLLLSTVFSASAGMVGPILSAEKNTKALGTSTLFGALTNIVFNIALVSIIGAQGAAIATAISSFLIFLLRYISAKQEIEGISLPRLFGFWIVICIQACLMIDGGHYLGQVVLIGAGIFMYKDNIGLALKCLKK